MDSKEIFYKPICLIEEQSTYIKEMLEDLMNLIRSRAIKKLNINVNDAMRRSMNLLTDELRIRRIKWDLQLGKDLPGQCCSCHRFEHGLEASVPRARRSSAAAAASLEPAAGLVW